MYPPGKISEYLNIPASTLRHYAKIYAAHLSPSAQGRRRLYTDQDLETLQRIRELSDQGNTSDEIRQALGEIITIDQVDDQQPSSSLALIPAISKEFESLHAILKQMSDDQQTLKDEIAALRRELDQAQRPFWDRIFKRKPGE